MASAMQKSNYTSNMIYKIALWVLILLLSAKLYATFFPKSNNEFILHWLLKCLVSKWDDDNTSTSVTKGF